jgi:hypothetical protein
MSAPLVPSPLDYIGRRHFALYPAIRNTTPNVWMLGTGSWSEVQFVNAKTGSEIWVPRVYIGAVSESVDSLVVGLTQDLELRGDEVAPRGRRVIEMPLHPHLPVKRHFAVEHTGPAPVIGIRLERPEPSTFHKTPFRLGIFVLFVAGLLALIAAASRIY